MRIIRIQSHAINVMWSAVQENSWKYTEGWFIPHSNVSSVKSISLEELFCSNMNLYDEGGTQLAASEINVSVL